MDNTPNGKGPGGGGLRARINAQKMVVNQPAFPDFKPIGGDGRGGKLDLNDVSKGS
jgi:hypothetical protein